MREVAIVSPVRTAVGNFGGGLKEVSAAELGATVIKAVLERTGLEPDKIDEVILGHGYPSGEEPAIGRLCALKAGLPIEVPGYQLDRLVLVRLAVDSQCLHDGADGQCRRGAGRRCGEYEPGGILYD